MTKKELSEAGLKLAKSQQIITDYGTEYLDRTIYHTVNVTDSAGNNLINSEGGEIIRNQVLYLAGSYVSAKELANALEIEKEFSDLNKDFRDDMTRQGLTWKLPREKQTVLDIRGITN